MQIQNSKFNFQNLKNPLTLALLIVCGVCAHGQGPFCGIVGTEGCTAVKCNDPRIIGWATGCEVAFGPMDIRSSSGDIVTFATSGADAIGPVVLGDNDSYNTMLVVPLGDGGSATVTFDEPIRNIPGFDFAVYENSFGDTFLELAFVEVSSDGEHFVRFPATSLTQTETQVGTYGSVDATYINNLAGKYRGGWGTPFDLEELRDSAGIDINNITHVRIVDVVGSIDPAYGTYDAFGHLVNDPFPTPFNSSGFDLDGVCVLGESSSINAPQHSVFESVYPNPASDRVVVSLNPANLQSGNQTIYIYDISGRCMMERVVPASSSSVSISTAQLRNGVYIVKVGAETVRLMVAR